MKTRIFKTNDVFDIYLDPQLKTKYEGKGKLLNYIRTSDPFILERHPITEKLNLTYVVEYWVVLINGNEAVRGIRRINNIGITPSNVVEEDIFDNTPATNIIDKFVSLPNYDTSEWDSRVDNTEVSGEMY